MDGYQERPTQEKRVLEILKSANGEWVDGMKFLNLDRPITQFHARIWGLQRKGFKIEGEFINNKDWKSYRLINEPGQIKLFM